jgi:hypothetical protein
MLPNTSVHYQLFYAQEMDRFLADLLAQKTKNDCTKILEIQNLTSSNKRAA